MFSELQPDRLFDNGRKCEARWKERCREAITGSQYSKGRLEAECAAAFRWPAAACGDCPCLASEAKVLLADEPTGNLDEDTAGEIIELLKKTAHELGKSVIVVTHSKLLAEEADKIYEIKNGKLCTE